MSTYAVVAAKRFCHAKQRLRHTLPGGARARLAEAMLTDVLRVLASVAAIDGIVVVTADAAAAAVAARFGAETIRDDAESGPSAAAAAGVRHARAHGATRALLLAGDCPALTAADLRTLLLAGDCAPAAAAADLRTLLLAGDGALAAAAAADVRAPLAAGAVVVVVPDRHGTGTNALLLSPPDAIAPAFGAGSCARHVAAARSAGATCRVLTLPSIALDLDTADDLEALRAVPRLGASTRALLPLDTTKERCA